MGAMGDEPNRLGGVTSCSFQTSVPHVEVTNYGDAYRSYVLRGAAEVEADIHIVARDAGALMRQFNQWLTEGITKPVYQAEYMCLYCGSPNGVEHTHCRKCGAPRSFVIG